MKNKVLSLILALLMAASSASAVLADDSAIADVDDVAVDATLEESEAGQYDKAIKFLNAYGIFKGKSADDLGAEDMLERYQMALFVARISTGYVDDDKWEDGPENWSEFTDISEGPVANYWGALSYANQKGIIEGYGNGKFGPTDGITYQNALTMVVRTLGYTGLEWPWGYIEKAVSLGLTDGITNVAYTQELNRGEVAQILYNALFATTKSGTTLAMSSFGIEFGWEKVVITASDLDIFTKDNEKAAATLESNNAYKAFKDSKKVDDGFVSFKLLNDDGSLGDDTYYMLGSDIGLSKEDNMHDDEAVVGDAYYLMFEKNEDDDLVKVVAVESLHTETLWNLGKTDDEGDAQEYAIKEYLAKNTLVDKYSTSEYVNITAKKYPEIMVFDKTGAIEEKVVNGNAIAIDWSTGDILARVKDDTEKDGWKKNEDGEFVYEVKYHYLPLLDRYYTVELDDDFGVIGYDWMSDKEFEKLVDEYKLEDVKTYKGFSAPITKLVNSAYASLELFDTDLNGVADRGIYEHYRLGKFSNSTVNCGSCGKDYASYKLEDVATIANAVNSADMYGDEKDDDDGDVIKGIYNTNTIVEGVVCSHIANRAWFVEGYEPEIAYDEDGDETGYANGYVIYSYDDETGAIKVVKNVDDGSDDDSFVATGVVRAYNTKTGTVTIDDTQYSIKDYDELEGNGFKYVTANAETRGQYTGLLRALFNQFVTYVVVDGELVHIEATNATKSDIIIVDSYAGLDTDGYIVVNGYLASELKYKQFRIGSYDGWERGDYYYYLDHETAVKSFTKGTIYAIASRDAENDVYYVNLAGQWDFTTREYIVENDVNLFPITITEGDDGYMYVDITKADKTHSKGDVKMSSTNKYVVIPKTVNGNPYASIIVYEGKLADGWAIEGDVINTDAYDKGTYVIVNAKVVADKDFYGDNLNAGLVLLLNDRATSISYNGADEETPYLLGASVFEYEVVDLYTGALRVAKYATNKSLKVGHVYATQGDVVVEDRGLFTITDIIGIKMPEVYPEYDIDYANYLFGAFYIDETTAPKLFKQVDVDGNGKKEDDDVRMFIGDLAAITSFQRPERKIFDGLSEVRGETKYYKGTIDDVAIRFVDHNDAYTKITDMYAIGWSEFEEVVEDFETYEFAVYFVYEVETENIVCYISKYLKDNDIVDVADDINTTNKVTVAEFGTDVLETLFGAEFADIDITIKSSIDYKKVTDENAALLGVVVDSVNFEFDGKTLDKATHANIKAWNMYFGEAGFCTVEDIYATFEGYELSADYVGYLATKFSTKTIKSAAIAADFSSIVKATYGHDAVCKCMLDGAEECQLVKSVKVPVKVLVKFTDGSSELVDLFVENPDEFELTVNLSDSELFGDGAVTGVVEGVLCQVVEEVLAAAPAALLQSYIDSEIYEQPTYETAEDYAEYLEDVIEWYNTDKGSRLNIAKAAKAAFEAEIADIENYTYLAHPDSDEYKAAVDGYVADEFTRLARIAALKAALVEVEEEITEAEEYIDLLEETQEFVVATIDTVADVAAGDSSFDLTFDVTTAAQTLEADKVVELLFARVNVTDIIGELDDAEILDDLIAALGLVF